MDQSSFEAIRHVVFESLEKNTMYQGLDKEAQYHVNLGVLTTLTALVQADFVAVPKQHWNRIVAERDSLESILIGLGLPMAVLTETEP